MPKETITPRAADYSQWYLDIVRAADLSENSGVRGCMIIKPYGFAIWELVRDALDARIKATGHVNAYFPLLIPMSYLTKEAEHVAGFAPEAWEVTRGGGEPLPETYVIRPTSETIIGEAFSRWIKSWRDLPMLVNQWANVMRWEMRTRPFLRTSEFLWQEGHTAHVTEEEAERETLMVLNDVYAETVENVMALPVLKGMKTEKEKFAGAVRTYTIEAMMQDGKALQSGTSHNLGQNFARSFDMKYLSSANTEEYCWTTSWGVSTRLIGALIMAHSDDEGLVLPPAVAPIQVVIVPLWRSDAEREQTVAAARRLGGDAGNRFRWHVDDRENLSPGFKYNEWEVKGVPVRVELGPRDLASGSVMVARRDLPGRDGKQPFPLETATERIEALLTDIQASIYKRALDFRTSHTFEVETLSEFSDAIESGFAACWFDGDSGAEDEIQTRWKATVRLLPLEPPQGQGACFYTGRRTTRRAVFARSY
ncbi:MAG: proline--tRNA ligase [Armatimonadetes bacterium]|nr:proline--tRNA ligase [Armatimonadota bacterium]MDE2207926.1 proline--tRNA ligase [Armatimonadota bacterium]